MKKVIGNVKTHEPIILAITFNFRADNRCADPTPIMEEVIVWVVLIGIPK